MKIMVGNVQSQLVDATTEEQAWIGNLLTFAEPRFVMRHGQPEKYEFSYCLYKPLLRVFPSGLLDEVLVHAKRVGFDCALVTSKPPPCSPVIAANVAWLRDYQAASIQALVQHQRGIIHAPTGSGKGEVIVGLTQVLPCRWLFLVHRTGLVQQQADRYETRTELPAGRIGEGRWDVPASVNFICASFQSVYSAHKSGKHIRGSFPASATELLLWAQAIAIDECHTVPSDTYLRIAMLTKNAYWRCGLSGTPLDRSDHKSILAIAATGPVIYRVKSTELIAAGVLANPRIRVTTIEQRIRAESWKVAYKAGITDSVIRNNAITESACLAEKPCMVFVTQLRHGKTLEKSILSAGMRCKFVWGKHPIEYRRKLLQQLAARDIDVLIASVIFQEGVDIPELRSVVLANAGKSTIGTLQKIGRGMRVSKDKKTFEVWDFFDVGNRMLQRHSTCRMSTYKNEGYLIEYVNKSETTSV